MLTGFESYTLVSSSYVFEGFLEFRWGPHAEEPLFIGNQIEMMANQIADAELPMLAAREVAIEDMDRRFAAEIDLDEVPWKDRSKATTKYYEDTGQSYSTILKRTGDLHSAATSRSSYDIIGNDMFINTSGWPPYWRAQHAGSHVGRGVKLPARSFAGLSERGQFEVLAIFDEWMGGMIDIIRPGATGIPMFRGAFGRIGGVAHRGPRRKIAPVPLGGVDPDFVGDEPYL